MTIWPVFVSALLAGNLVELIASKSRPAFGSEYEMVGRSVVPEENLIYAQPVFHFGSANLEDKLQNLEISVQTRKLRQSFSCESSLITITTLYTLGYSLSDPLRVDVQEINFQFDKGKKVVKYEYIEKKESFPVKVDAGFCSHDEEQPIVMLLSSDFGFCDDCEWIDFYTTEGTYLGSDKIPTIPGLPRISTVSGTKKFKYFEFRNADKVDRRSIFSCDPKYCTNVISGLR